MAKRGQLSGDLFREPSATVTQRSPTAAPRKANRHLDGLTHDSSAASAATSSLSSRSRNEPLTWYLLGRVEHRGRRLARRPSVRPDQLAERRPPFLGNRRQPGRGRGPVNRCRTRASGATLGLKRLLQSDCVSGSTGSCAWTWSSACWATPNSVEASEGRRPRPLRWGCWNQASCACSGAAFSVSPFAELLVLGRSSVVSLTVTGATASLTLAGRRAAASSPSAACSRSVFVSVPVAGCATAVRSTRCESDRATASPGPLNWSSASCCSPGLQQLSSHPTAGARRPGHRPAPGAGTPLPSGCL